MEKNEDGKLPSIHRTPSKLGKPPNELRKLKLTKKKLKLLRNLSEAKKELKVGKTPKPKDAYCGEYDEAALQTVEKLRDQHTREYEMVKRQMHSKALELFTPSKKLSDLRKHEELYTKAGRMEEARSARTNAYRLQCREEAQHKVNVAQHMEQYLFNLRIKHQAAFTTLVQRIQQGQSSPSTNPLSRNRRKIRSIIDEEKNSLRLRRINSSSQC